MSTVTADRETISVSRYHGTGNDFLLVDAQEPVAQRRAFARRVCDRDEGVGVDGVLFLALEPDFTPPRVVMTLVQPDGSTAPMCGNGARCAAAWAMGRTGAHQVMIDTQAGSRLAERIPADAGGSDLATDSDEPDRRSAPSDEPVRIAVEMAQPTVEPATIPVHAEAPIVDRPASGLDPATDDGASATDAEALDASPTVGDLRTTVVNTGVPHVVAFVADVEAVALDRLGPAIRHAEAFPRGTNVTLASPVTHNSAGGAETAVFDQRTYERGVEGETDACGTGAVAIAAAATRLDRFPAARRWELRPPGGVLQVRFDEHRRAVLEGPVVHESTLALSVSDSGDR